MWQASTVCLIAAIWGWPKDDIDTRIIHEVECGTEWDGKKWIISTDDLWYGHERIHYKHHQVDMWTCEYVE